MIASALEHMHEKRIIHRDLKPANIFVDSDDSLKVGDLGLGRLLSVETICAVTKVGTPLYMSPELLNGEGYDMRTDIWSLGCIIYELCELKSPFRNEAEKISMQNLFDNITKGAFKDINARYSSELSWVISNTIQVDPKKRISAREVAETASQMLGKNLKRTRRYLGTIVAEDIAVKLDMLDYRK
jgi:serine/threonine protein kinase